MTEQNFQLFNQELAKQSVTLVAVSKTKSAEEILKLYQWGQKDFGENYVQELLEKHDHLPADIRWHFIGHLQRNKVKYIAPFVSLIQSVDSEKLLREIDKEAKKNSRTIDVLLQVHIADEETKFGLDQNELIALMKNLNQYPNANVKGLMGMATNSEDEQKVAMEFSALHELFLNCKSISANTEVLSMGMSADYKIAIGNGSNMVRIGSLLFGARH